MKLNLLALRDVILYTRNGRTEQHRYWEQPWTDDVFWFDGRVYALFHDDGFVWYCPLDSSEVPAYLMEATPRKLRTTRSKTSWKDWGNMDRVMVEGGEPMLFVPVSDRAWETGYTGDHRLTGAQYLSYPEEIFQEQVRGGQSGRVICYMQPKANDSRCKLFFLPDGTGFFRGMVSGAEDGNPDARYDLLDRIVAFTWDASNVDGLADPADILAAPAARLLPLCEQILNEQVRPRLQNLRSVSRESSDDSFIRGSRAELARLTYCICHADDALWSGPHSQDAVDITYHARYVCSKSLLWLDGEQSQARCSGTQKIGKNTEQMLNLAFRENRFRGGVWHYNKDQDDAWVSRFLHSGSQIGVQVARPSAHERAEALLTLSDWLEGKVSDEERNRLLGLS